MARSASSKKVPAKNGGANLGFEAKLRAAAAALRPKLISGELRMRDAERVISGVA